MKHYDFNEIIERKGTHCIKFDALKENFGRDDLMSFWIADMDFRTPDFIIDALKARCNHPVFGYTYAPDEYYESIIRWVHDLHGWDIRREWLSYIPGIVKGFAFALDHFTRKGDKVIIQPPVYHPFHLVPEAMHREVVCNPLRLTNGSYEMDFEHLESVIDEHCKVLILSNPHNPAGIVWRKETLQKLAAICAKHGILVISDEIHAEMAYPDFTHHPFPTVSDEEFYSFLESGEFNHGTIFAYTATIAAYTHGAEWRQQMLDYVAKNVDFVDDYLKQHIPTIKIYRPQASFLLWLDCRGLKLSQKELVSLFEDKAHLALNNGAMFGQEGEGFMRLNVGCPRATLETAMDRLRNAVKS